MRLREHRQIIRKFISYVETRSDVAMCCLEDGKEGMLEDTDKLVEEYMELLELRAHERGILHSESKVRLSDEAYAQQAYDEWIQGRQ